MVKYIGHNPRWWVKYKETTYIEYKKLVPDCGFEEWFKRDLAKQGVHIFTSYMLEFKSESHFTMFVMRWS